MSAVVQLETSGDPLPLIGGILSDGDIDTLFDDAEAPVELVTTLLTTLWEKMAAQYDATYQDQFRLETLFEKPGVKRADVMDRLLPLIFGTAVSLKMGEAHNLTIDSLVLELIGSFPFSAEALAKLVNQEKAEWQTGRLAVLTDVLARRAATFERVRGKRRVSKEAIGYLEDLFFDERTKAGEDTDTGPLLDCLHEVLARMHPALSLPLLDLGIDTKCNGKSLGHYLTALQFVRRAEVFTEERANRLLKLCVQGVDGCLADNPSLPAAYVWQIYARYAALNDGYTAGKMLGHREDFRELVVKWNLTAAAAGIVARLLTNHEGELIEPVLARVAVAGCQLITEAYKVETISGFLCRLLGDDAALVLIERKTQEIGFSVAGYWLEKPVDGPVLDALLRWPHQAVRLSLCVIATRRGRKPRELMNIEEMPDPVRTLYQAKILPRLLSDRASEVSSAARELAIAIAHKNNDGVVAIQTAALHELGDCLGYVETVDDHVIEALVGRFKGRDSLSECYIAAAVEGIAPKEQLTVRQGEMLAALDCDAVTAAAASALQLYQPGIEDFLWRVKATGPLTLFAAAARDCWQEDRRRSYFVAHKNERVRTALATTSSSLSLTEVVNLLADRSEDVRQSLVANGNWKRYAALLADSVKS